MKRSQTPFLIALAAVLAILVVINELGRKPAAQPPAPPTVQREYSNPALGIALELPQGWTFADSLSADGKRLRASLEITQLASGVRLSVRATSMPWEYFVPLAKTKSDLREPIVVGKRQGWATPVGGGMIYATVESDGTLLELLGPKALLDSVIAGSRWIAIDSARGAIAFERPSALPERVRRWRQECQGLDLTAFGSTLEDGTGTYLYAGSGQRPTGGYRAMISGIVRAGNERIAVFADFTRPRFGDVVSQAYSYPSDVVVIEGSGYSAQFFGDGDDAPPIISRLVGIDSLPRVFDQSRTIKVFAPAPNVTVDGSVHFSGIVHGTVDRLFSRLLDPAERVAEAKSRPLQASPDWLMVTDTLALPSPAAPGSMIHLELYTIDDASGDVVDQIRIPLRVRKR